MYKRGKRFLSLLFALIFMLSMFASVVNADEVGTSEISSNEVNTDEEGTKLESENQEETDGQNANQEDKGQESQGNNDQGTIGEEGTDEKNINEESSGKDSNGGESNDNNIFTVQSTDETTIPTNLEKISKTANLISGSGNPITITTANLFEINNSYVGTKILFEISGLEPGDSNIYIARVTSSINQNETSWVIHRVSDSAGFLDINLYDQIEGKVDYSITIQKSAGPSYETVDFSIYLVPSVSPSMTIEEMNSKDIILSHVEFEPYIEVNLPADFNQERIDTVFKLIKSDSGEVYAVNDYRYENPYFYSSTIYDYRYKKIFSALPEDDSLLYLRYDINIGVAELYCGRQLEPGEYDVGIFKKENGSELLIIPKVVTVTDKPYILTQAELEEYPRMQIGSREIYAGIRALGENINLNDYDLGLYDKEDNLVAESNGEYILESTYEYSVNAVYKLTVNPGKEITSGPYKLKVITETDCYSEESSFGFSEYVTTDIYKYLVPNPRYANIVMYGEKLKPGKRYKAILSTLNADYQYETVAEKIVVPYNNTFDIEFTDSNGEVLSLENDKLYFVEIFSKNELGEWDVEECEISFYNHIYEEDGGIGIPQGNDSFGHFNVRKGKLVGYISLPNDVAAPMDLSKFKVIARNILDMAADNYVYQNFEVTKQTGEEMTNFTLEQDVLVDMPVGHYVYEAYYDGQELKKENGRNICDDRFFTLYSNAPLVEGLYSYKNNLLAVNSFWIENIDNVSNVQLKLYNIEGANVQPVHTIDLVNEDGRHIITSAESENVNFYKKYKNAIYVNGIPIGNTGFSYNYFAPLDMAQDNNPYTITIFDEITNGSIEATVLGDKVTEATKGTEIYIKNKPAEGYQLKPGSIKVNGEPIIGRSFILGGDTEITAEFESVPDSEYTITIDSANIFNGTISVNTTEAVPGEKIEVEAFPSYGFELKELKYMPTDGGTYIDIDLDTMSFIMPAEDIVIWAAFGSPDSHRVTILSSEGGEVLCESYYVEGGDTVNLYINTVEGFKLVSLYYINNVGDRVNIIGSGTLYSFTMPSYPVTVYAEFAEVHSITIAPTSNGTVSTEYQYAAPNELIFVTIEPADGYRIKDDKIYVNGKSFPVSSVSGEAFFPMPDEDVVISVEFEPIPLFETNKLSLRSNRWRMVLTVPDKLYDEVYNFKDDPFYTYIETIIKDKDGNEILRNKMNGATRIIMETPEDKIYYYYQLYKTAPISPGVYTAEVIISDESESFESKPSINLGKGDIIFGDYLEVEYIYAVNYYGNELTTDTRNFTVEVELNHLFTDLPNLKAKLVDKYFGNTVAEAPEKRYLYPYGITWEEAELNDIGDRTYLAFDFTLTQPLEKNYIYEIVFDYDTDVVLDIYAENSFSVVDQPKVLYATILDDGITLKTECVPEGEYIASYSENGETIEYDLIIDSDGNGTIDFGEDIISKDIAEFYVREIDGYPVYFTFLAYREVQEDTLPHIDIENSLPYYSLYPVTQDFVNNALPISETVSFNLIDYSGKGKVELIESKPTGSKILETIDISDLDNGRGTFNSAREYAFSPNASYKIRVIKTDGEEIEEIAWNNFIMPDFPFISTGLGYIQEFYGDTLVIPYSGAINITDFNKVMFYMHSVDSAEEITVPVIGINDKEIKLDMTNAPSNVFVLRSVHKDYKNGEDRPVTTPYEMKFYKVNDNSPVITAIGNQEGIYYATGLRLNSANTVSVKLFKPEDYILTFVKEVDITNITDNRIDIPQSAFSGLENGRYIAIYIIDGIEQMSQVVDYTGPVATEFTVTFVDHDGSILKTEVVPRGGSATAPADPTREGYTFIGWDKPFDNVTGNITVKAVYEINKYTVTFIDWDGTVIKTQEVEYGKGATAPEEDPTREGYTFKGWDRPFDNITGNITVKALYQINKYTVTFLDWDDTVLKTQEVEYGKGATAPVSPAREGYTFKGWDTDFNRVTGNLTVRAIYEANKLSVYFNSMGGSKVDPIAEINYDSTIPEPNPPTREGYDFAGWYKDFQLTQQWNFETDVVKTNITLYAKWVAKSYSITVSGSITGGTIIAPETAREGEPVTLTIEPEGSNILKSIWWTAAGAFANEINIVSNNKAVFKMPSRDIEINATFNEMATLYVQVSKAESPYSVEVFSVDPYFSGYRWITAGTLETTFIVPKGTNYFVYISMGENEDWYWESKTVNTVTTDTVSFTIPVTYSISGKITCTNGNIDNIYDFYLYARSGNIYRYAYIDDNGNYEIKGLASGTYTVGIENWSGKYAGVLTQEVTIAGEDVHDINFSIAKGADLRVNLSKTNGTPAFMA
ncbi:MAG TPA: InlB B-repeat-containing protein, partial [Clostridiaceae bacterium]|nr:InlB B-repeat-containing protein [Clostridiaceae bacterium]